MSLWLDDGDVRLFHGDSLEVLRELPDESVDCVVTSPPYWGLRDYGTEGQLGLEATPDLFVAGMVELFREVRRVLAPHGTCWVNLGDSYAHNTETHPTNRGTNPKMASSARARILEPTGVAKARGANLKPKDLVGIPWRVAFALQQPWERHVIAREADRAWMAGLVDGEGCVSVCAVQPTTGVNESHSMRVQIRMADTEAVERVVAITGMSKVTYDLDTGDGSRPAQQWKISGDKAADVLADMYPYLTVKRRQAIVGWNLQRLKDGVVTKRGQPIPRENMEKRRALHDVLRKLNQREPVDIPSWCREPFVETEPGWYLRSDVIWSKPNPMPESVTDRPTKAHEYVFLLTKQPRYWFDAEAVREPHSPDGRKQTKHIHATDNSHPNYDNVGNGNERWPNAGRNIRSVWQIATQPYPEAHFATFPEELARRCILAGCPERVCLVCGSPWVREIEPGHSIISGKGWHDHSDDARQGQAQVNKGQKAWDTYVPPQTIGFRPSCACVAPGIQGRVGVTARPVDGNDLGGQPGRERGLRPGSELGSEVAPYRPGVVLDPFIGSGTTAKVARDHQRHAIGIDLSAEYLELAARRLQQLSLLAQ